MNFRAHRPRRIAALAAGLLAAASIAVPQAEARTRPMTEHERIIAFWTPERVAKAVPRDFVYDPATKRFALAGKPGGGGGGGGSTSVTGSSWTGGGEVLANTGKVLFAMGSSYYVCSAAVVDDNNANRSIILTAGHCVWDPATGFSTNWIFIPEYDTLPARLTTSGSFCSGTKWGCWTASSLVASDVFAGEPGFTTTATLHDYAFAVVGAGGHNSTQLDATVGSQPIAYSALSAGTNTWLFGYPASGKYKGNDLVYSRGSLGFDTNTGNQTYRVTSNMTGGSSGGPWFAPFVGTTGVGTGTLVSVNSYGYGGVTAMFGPILNSETSAMFSAALTTTVNVQI